MQINLQYRGSFDEAKGIYLEKKEKFKMAVTKTFPHRGPLFFRVELLTV